MSIQNSVILMSDKEKTIFPRSSFSDEATQLAYLLENRIMLQVDWKGEEEDFMIGDFFKERCATLKPGIDFKAEAPYKKLQAEISKGKLQTGGSVPLLLKEFQKLLKPHGLVVLVWDQGNDSYYIGIAFAEDLKRMAKSISGTNQFVPFGSKTGEVLYTVNCSCGSMNVWQLKRGEVLTDDCCQDCGKELFDKEGNSSLPVIKEYI